MMWHICLCLDTIRYGRRV